MTPTKDSHTIKAVLIRIRNKTPELLLLEHKVREDTAPQKRGGKFKEWRRWGLPGGKVELNENLLTTLIRETWEEIHLRLSAEMFKEEHIVHCPIKPSLRAGYDTHQDHYMFAILPQETEIEEIESDNDEIVRGQFFPLDKIPTPDDALPFTRNQLRGLVEMLRHLIGKVEDADKWSATVEKWAYPYLTTRK
ncbi:MAG: NUDIX hydrolase [Candidatus Parcubacteria bacterium]|nr:NUDIX hydrolase [Candidatus Parcubacteria bacterium]